MDILEAPKKCSNTWCHRTLPLGSQRKTCETCREKNRDTQKQSRARKKDKSNIENVFNEDSGPGSKRRRNSSGNSSGRPSQRIKHNNHEGNGDESESDSDCDNYFKEPADLAAINYLDSEEFFDDLKDEAKAGRIEMHASFPVEIDTTVTAKERAQMVTEEIRNVTGYRWTVKDHKKLRNGHRIRLWCSQDIDHRKASKPSTREDAKARDNLGMARFPCKSRLSVKYRDARNRNSAYMVVVIQHHMSHVQYLDISMPLEAKQLVQEQAEWATPSALAARIRKLYPNVANSQVYHAWKEFSQSYWRRDNCEIKSAKALLKEFPDDVDIFDITNVPDGVEILAWGMKKIAHGLQGRILEVGMDATYNTNSRHLELYSIMAEYDNAGFPLTYCLLTTATAIDLGKRKKALAAWGACVRETYKVSPIFTHVDKDLGEIGALNTVWPKAKISLCWWHLRRAVRTRLAKAKLATTPYNVRRAISEFDFIEENFVPSGTKVDIEDFEGGMPDDAADKGKAGDLDESNQYAAPPPQQRLNEVTNALRIRLPPPSLPTTQISGEDDDSESAESADIPEVQDLPRTQIRGTGFTLLLQPVDGNRSSATEGEEINSQASEEDEESRTRRTFCPADLREPVIAMLERHFCAHPAIPGYCAPDPVAIKRWAVHQAYRFCAKNELPELWAYLWENWYRKGRWELWARSAHELIPVLKTTMILESHWRKIKHDFLHHFKLPRCDLLAWILVSKLANTYYIKLANLLTVTGRYRELCSWRKDFKSTWKKLEKREITMPINDAYRPDAKKWTCTCPSFVTSRFLICKHLVQQVDRVPPNFFLEVKRHRSAPFWRHESLAIDGGGISNMDPATVEDSAGTDRGGVDDDDELPSDGDEDDTSEDEGMMGMVEDGRTSKQALAEDINLITDFLAGLKFQAQFNDPRFLNALEKECAGFFRVAKSCIEKEKKLRRTTGPTPSTWDNASLTALFYRARPATTSST